MAGDNTPYTRDPSCLLEAIYDDIIEGEWCDRCVLPSAMTMTQLIYDRRTLRLLSTRRLLMCRDCGSVDVLVGE